VRALLRIVFRRALRIFFRRIEIEGLERFPAGGPVIFVANHPNALVDPLLLLCFAPRSVSFLAKAPLFRMPLVGLFVRAFGSIPVYRPQDHNSDLARNRETFEAAGRLLEAGGALALFPEGASHDEPSLLPMKTGAARMALGAAARTEAPISVVPVGLYYTFKQRFRSSVLITFGDPITVTSPALDADGDPPRVAVRALTERIGAALSELAVQAETREALDLIRRAERIYSAGDPAKVQPALSEELERRRRFASGYRTLRENDPARLTRLQERIARFEAERRAAGLSLAHLTPEGLTPRAMAGLLCRNLAALLVLPIAAAGLLIHYPLYWLIGRLARRIARGDEDLQATCKIGLSVLAFPLLWLGGAIAAWRLLGKWPAVLTLVGLPISGWAALRFAESLDELTGRARALLHRTAATYATKRLLAQRRALRLQMEEVARELEARDNS
jgi:1-acyl-sn-glycerol-3-phosphate acyltransferase